MMYKQIILFVTLLFFASVLGYGSNYFYAEFLYSNAQYGNGAAFSARAWYYNNGGNFIKMRVDYLYSNGTTLQSQYFDFNTQDRYQVCGSNCARQTYTAAAPSFDTTSGFTATTPTCPTPDYAFPKCNPGCLGFYSNPNQAQGVDKVAFQSASPNNLCYVRWTINSPDTSANEWHITNYRTSGFTAANIADPANNQTYQDVITSVSCPQPTCQSVADIALVLDESGSIQIAKAYPDVQNFALTVINSFNGSYGANGTRIGLTYFSGLQSCENCSDTQTFTSCTSYCTKVNKQTTNCLCTSYSYFDITQNKQSTACNNCGGRWNTTISQPTPDQALLQSTIINHPIAQGATCLSCGVVEGTKILNADVRPGVPRIMFFFTDGIQNINTDFLDAAAKGALAQGIIVYAIGISGKYNETTLNTIAGNSSRVYISPDFKTLATIVPQIVKTFCSPLPPFQICPNCNGLCACSATCTCPSSCDDNNACTTDFCNLQTTTGATGQNTYGKCLYVSNTTVCDDQNPCTQDICYANGTCSYPPIDKTTAANKPPGPDTNCYYYTCSKISATSYNWVKTANTSYCPSSSDPCIIKFCDNATQTCVTYNRNNTASGQTVTYTDAFGNQNSFTGCGPPSPIDKCKNFFCGAGGTCVTQQVCECSKDSDCLDSSGCTTDTCNLTTNKCVRTAVDCYAILSNNKCSLNTAYNTDNTTGYAVYTGSTNPLFTQVDSNKLPSPSTNTDRTCDQLACYAGQPSTYSCQSTGTANGAYTCARSFSSCTLSACSDNICRSVGQSGAWAGGNLKADCGVTIVPNCDDGKLCTTDSCNSAWLRTQPVSQRCINNDNSTTCNKANVCFTYGCNNSTGCTQTAVPIKTNNTCFGYYCDSSLGPQSVDLSSTNCPQTTNLCIVPYCNVTTGCQSVNKSNIDFQTSVTVTNSNGQTITVSGCRTPASSPYCLSYYCNTTSGNCVKVDNCQCYTDNDCNDKNGCTNERCVNYTCVRSNVDCYSQLSNGSCALNTPYSTSNATGYAFLTNTLDSNYSAVDANGNPNPSSGVPRDCDQLACYAGQPSTYSCSSTGDNSYQCTRTVSQTCTLSSCKDFICRSIGQSSTWAGGNVQADCGVSITPDCNDNNVCNIDSCNTTWSRSDSSDLRCIHVDNSSNCNPNTVCKSWSCNPSSGCQVATLPVPTNTTCKGFYCDPITGNQSVCLSACTAVDLCHIPYCDVGSDSCKSVNKSSFSGTQTYQDCAGVISVTGCKAPDNAPICLTYFCNTTTGNCQVINNCSCSNDTDCNDGDGCTVDTCNVGLGVCSYSKYDCYSIVSNGSCAVGTNYTTSNATGYAFYSGTLSNLYSDVDSAGLPTPSTGVKRDCDQLACYAGQPSTYSCKSNGDYSYQCVRTVNQNCSLGSCSDSICRSIGQSVGWTDTKADCGVTITPNCDDGKLCTTDYCNTTWSHSASSSLRCVNVDNSSTCNPNDACKNWGCNNSTGCTSSPVSIPTNTTCYGYYCDSSLGIQKVCIGSQQCAQGVDLCTVTYCNNTNCINIKKTDYDFGTTQTFVDGCGTSYPVSGCRTPASSPYCLSYYCNTTSGNCVKVDNCQCYTDNDCLTGDGCTTDICVNYTCVRTTVDCYSQLSNGSCSLNTVYNTDNTTGYAIYTGSTNAIYTALDSNGNPTPSSGTPRTCDQLLCYNGQPSTYSCVATGTANGAYTCTRSVVKTCDLGSCSDNICRSIGQTGTWGTNTLSDCGVTIVPNCDDGSVCTVDNCNATWSRSDSPSLRCTHNSNASNCDPNDICYSWGCNPTTGCFKTILPLLGTNDTCFQYSCDPIKGNQTFEVGSTNCPQNTSNYCFINYCDPNSKSCKQIDLTTTSGTVTYTNSLGANITVTGCKKPSTDLITCRQYSCDPTNGKCKFDTSTCVCLTNNDCDDFDGCTTDSCDTVANQCNHVKIDCFDVVSSKGCSLNQAFTGSTETGEIVWNGTATNIFTKVDSNGLPIGYSSSIKYNCDQIACYNNQPSTYYCNSTSSTTYQCYRLISNCPSDGCAAGRCRTYGNWTANGQITTDCSNNYYSTCVSTDRCQIAYCNSSVSDPRASDACFNFPFNITEHCGDGDFCTEDLCDSASTDPSPCYYVRYNEDTLKQNLCTKFSACQTVTCLASTCIYTTINCNSSSACTYYVCNSTTNNTCVAVNSTVNLYDICGVCNGNNLSCAFTGKVTPKYVSIGVAVGVGTGVAGFFACAAAIFAARKGYDKYKELSSELNGQVKVSEAYKGAEHGGENFGMRASAIN